MRMKMWIVDKDKDKDGFDDVVDYGKANGGEDQEDNDDENV